MQTCVFCDEWGSSAYPEQATQDLKTQINEKLILLGQHRKAEHFLAYFQTYTATFMSIKKLKNHFDQALSFSQVKGIIIGTRPDCFSDAVYDLLNEYKQKTYVSVELGVQSFFDHHLDFLKRGHSAEIISTTIQKIKAKTGVDIGLHLIFGLPNETEEEILKTAELINALPVEHVKLHNLHVLKNTELEEIYNGGGFMPLELEEYTRRTILFLEHLSPHISIERLAALSSRWEELVAPAWTKDKLKVREYIIAEMRKNHTYQGKKISPLFR